MALFGMSRKEVANMLRDGNESFNGRLNDITEELDNERIRIYQLVAVLLSIMSKRDLKKKLEKGKMRYGSIFPPSWFDDDYKVSVKELLERIDP